MIFIIYSINNFEIKFLLINSLKLILMQIFYIKLRKAFSKNITFKNQQIK